MLYPLKFKPIYKQKIWGGSKLKDQLHKTDAPDKCGESWEISAVQNDVSIVDNGYLKGNSLQELIEIYMGDLVGDSIYKKYGIEFPLLIKFIDASDDLSIQVHPDDALAKKRHNAFGKTEAWYIMDADAGTKLIDGFKKEISHEEFMARVNEENLEPVLNAVPINSGEVYFIPAGRVHAIMKGTLLAEIQQTSDITYRIYDWGRKDAQGRGRELHTQLAVDAIDFSPIKDVRTEYPDKANSPCEILHHEKFVLNSIRIDTPLRKSYHSCPSFVILLCINGAGHLETEPMTVGIKKGDSLLIPHEIEEVTFHSESHMHVLEIYIDVD